jgi:hypothetical protein
VDGNRNPISYDVSVSSGNGISKLMNKKRSDNMSQKMTREELQCNVLAKGRKQMKGIDNWFVLEKYLVKILL